MFGTEELLTQLITCDFIVCYDMFVHLSLSLMFGISFGF